MRNVTYLEGRRSRNPPRDGELKRLALQLAVQLPEDTQDALDTIEHLKTLVRSFMCEQEPL